MSFYAIFMSFSDLIDLVCCRCCSCGYCFHCCCYWCKYWRWACPLGRYSSQRQLRSGLVLWLGGPSPAFVENRSKDFGETWHECSVGWGKETYTAVFPWKLRLINYSWKRVLSIFWSLGPPMDSKLCMNVQYDKEKKRTRPFFRENFGSLIIHENAFWAFSGVWDLRWTRNLAWMFSTIRKRNVCGRFSVKTSAH